MNTSKKVTIGNITYKMHQVAYTGWVFVNGTKSSTKRNAYSVAKIEDGKIIELDEMEAINGVTNQELAEAWIAA